MGGVESLDKFIIFLTEKDVKQVECPQCGADKEGFLFSDKFLSANVNDIKSMNTKHIIQIMGLTEENGNAILKLLGFIFVEDKKQIVFNPSIEGQKKLHWTWHEDGMVHSKGEDGP